MALQPMTPIYFPKRQGLVSDEDYDTGIAQNEENCNQNFNRLYEMVVSLQAENEALKKAIQGTGG